MTRLLSLTRHASPHVTALASAAHQCPPTTPPHAALPMGRAQPRLISIAWRVVTEDAWFAFIISAHTHDKTSRYRREYYVASHFSSYHAFDAIARHNIGAIRACFPARRMRRAAPFSP